MIEKQFKIGGNLASVLIAYLETQPLGQVKVLYSELTGLEEIKEEPAKEELKK